MHRKVPRDIGVGRFFRGTPHRWPDGVNCPHCGHAIGVAIDAYTESDLESRLEAVTKLELALADRKPAAHAAAVDSASEPGFRGKTG